MTKDVKTTTVTPEIFLEEDYKEPSKYFIVDCLGNRVYVHLSDRAKCQSFIDEEYGKGKYTIRTNKMQKGGAEISCRGSMNSKSHAGAKLVSIRNSQGRGLK